MWTQKFQQPIPQQSQNNGLSGKKKTALTQSIVNSISNPNIGAEQNDS